MCPRDIGWRSSHIGVILAVMGPQPTGDDKHLPGLVIPDDASALDADRWRLYEELAGRGDIHHPPDVPTDADHPSHWREGIPWFGRFGFAAVPVIFMVAATLAMVASLTLTTIKRTDPVAATSALALNAGPAGEIGGLLPAVDVTLAGEPRQLRDMRPVVLLIVPTGDCPTCADTAASLSSQAAAAGVRVLPVTTAAGQDAGATLARQISSAAIVAPAGTFDTYAPAGPTALVVSSDGVVTTVLRNSSAATDLTSSLAQATTSGQ